MPRALAQTVVLQSLSTVLVLATTLYISRIGGPDAQGGFALVKSISDMQVAICSLGLPSGIVYVLNKTKLGHRPMLRASLGYVAVLIAGLIAFDIFLLMAISPESDLNTLLIQAALFGTGSALATGFALQRGIVLVRSDGWAFSLLSTLPAVIIALIVVTLLGSISFAVETAYGIAGLLCLAASTLYLRRSLRALPVGILSDIDWLMLRQQSSQVFVQAIIFGLQFFLTNAWLESIDPTLRSAGLFSIASMVITLPNQLVAMVAPILYSRWSKMLDWADYRVIVRNAASFAAVAQGAALLSIPLVGWVVGIMFGMPFVAAKHAAIYMLFSIFPLILGRILTPALQGLGYNRIVTQSCIARFAVGGLSALISHWLGISPLLVCAIGWVVGEYTALIVLWRGAAAASR